MARVLIAGCGYVGSVLGTRLVEDGDEVFGLRRDPAALPAGIIPVAADLTRLETLSAIPDRVDVAVYAVGAKARDEASYRAVYLDGLDCFLRGLREQGERPRRVLFTSSTSVYAQRRGEWVDEDSTAEPDRFAGEITLLAERLLVASGLPSTIVRFGGIYGPGRTRMIDQVRSGEAALPASPHYTNRIHRDDAAAALRHLIRMDEPSDLVLGVDDEPADQAVVLRWLANRLGVAPPPTADAASGSRPRAGSKRCSNRRLRESGFVFRYPSFREGYESLLSG